MGHSPATVGTAGPAPSAGCGGKCETCDQCPGRTRKFWCVPTWPPPGGGWVWWVYSSCCVSRCLCPLKLWESSRAAIGIHQLQGRDRFARNPSVPGLYCQSCQLKMSNSFSLSAHLCKLLMEAIRWQGDVVLGGDWMRQRRFVVNRRSLVDQLPRPSRLISMAEYDRHINVITGLSLTKQ